MRTTPLTPAEAPPAALRSPARTISARKILAALLTVRGVINAGFAVWIWNERPAWSEFFHGTATYAFADGLVALLVATLVFRKALGVTPWLLGAATMGDGLVRIATAIALRIFPGLPDFPVATVLFFGSLGACAACLAVIAIAIRLTTWKAQRRSHRAPSLQLHETFDPVFVAGVVALALVVYALIAGPPVSLDDYRNAGTRWSIIFGLSFTIAAIGVGATPSRQRD